MTAWIVSERRAVDFILFYVKVAYEKRINEGKDRVLIIQDYYIGDEMTAKEILETLKRSKEFLFLQVK